MSTLYSEIKSYIKPHSLQKNKTTNELLKMPKQEFKDILALYIVLAGIMKSEGISDIKVPAPVLNESGKAKHVDFIARDFDYIILSKGNNIMNDLILESTMKKCAAMVESYISNKLISKNPQLEYFTQFQLGNYEGLEYVFNRNVFNEDVLFTYKDEDGKEIEVREKSFYNSLKKEDLSLIQKSIQTTDKIAALLMRLERGHFIKYKKFVLIAAEEAFKGNDLEQNGEFMLELHQAIQDQNLTDIIN